MAARQVASACGFLAVDKPAGMTTFDVVRRILAAARPRFKIGHAGTLDPEATGVVVLMCGTATRLGRFLPTEKRYTAEAVFGLRTTSEDLDGDVVLKRPDTAVGADQLERALASVASCQSQRPPAASALHMGGRRLHELHRAGQDLPAPVARRPAHIDSLSLLRFTPLHPTLGLPSASVDVRCGGGVYVRSIVRDLGLVCRRDGAVLSAEDAVIDAASAQLLLPAPASGDGGARPSVRAWDDATGGWAAGELDPGAVHACLASLRRTEACGYVADAGESGSAPAAVTLDEAVRRAKGGEAALLAACDPPAAALRHLPRAHLGGTDLTAFRHGKVTAGAAARLREAAQGGDEHVLVCEEEEEEGAVAGVAHPKPARTVVVLPRN